MLDNLAELYGAQGRYADAELLYKRALEIREKAVGPDHTDTAMSLSNLAELYRAQGRYADAELLHKRSLAINEKALGSSLSETVEQIEGTYEGTFTLSQVTGDHQISLTFQQSGPEVAVTYRSALGGRGSGKGTIAGNIIAAMPLRSETNCPGLYTASFKFSGDTVSWTYSGQDCNGPAQGRGIANKQKFVSPWTGELPSAQKLVSPPWTGEMPSAQTPAQEARILMGKIDELKNLARYAEAIPLQQRLLVLTEMVLGSNHPQVAISMGNLAGLYNAQGRYARGRIAF